MSELSEFHRELIADIQGEADVDGTYTTEAFFEKMGDILTEAGELDGADYAYFEGTGQNGVVLQVDGYGGDPRDAQGMAVSSPKRNTIEGCPVQRLIS